MTEAVDISQSTLSSQLDMRVTMLYFLDENDYILPVQAEIQWEEGIGKAALSMLIDGREEEIKLNSLGLFPPVPSGVTFDLDITDHIATVDIMTNGNELPKGSKQKKMLSCICNTLLCFESVESVCILIDGEKVNTTTSGDIDDEYLEPVSNIEPAGSEENEALGYAHLYFISSANNYLVPVKRIASDLSPANVVSQLLAPSINTSLCSPIPPTVDVLSVTVVGTTVEVNLSKEFEQVIDDPVQKRLALTALNKSLTCLDDIEQVQVLIEGKEYNPVIETIASNSFYNILE